MPTNPDLVLDAWRINARATSFLVESISSALWSVALPKAPRRAVRNICAHLHNSRCSWLKGLAVGARIAVPPRLAPSTATQPSVLSALNKSSEAMLRLFEVGLQNDGEFPKVSSSFVWGAWPRNALLFLAYAVSHEAHHRGQVLLIARESGQRFPPKVVGGLWQWSSRLRESRPKRTVGA